MAEEQYLTAEGAAELRKELEELINVRRPALAAQLKDAISQGDLSENADYHDAKEQQAFLEGRIQYLENLLRSATIIGEGEIGVPAEVPGPSPVSVTVMLYVAVEGCAAGFAPVAAAVCLATLIAFKTGGVF